MNPLPYDGGRRQRGAASVLSSAGVSAGILRLGLRIGREHVRGGQPEKESISRLAPRLFCVLFECFVVGCRQRRRRYLSADGGGDD